MQGDVFVVDLPQESEPDLAISCPERLEFADDSRKSHCGTDRRILITQIKTGAAKLDWLAVAECRETVIEGLVVTVGKYCERDSFASKVGVQTWRRSVTVTR